MQATAGMMSRLWRFVASPRSAWLGWRAFWLLATLAHIPAVLVLLTPEGPAEFSPVRALALASGLVFCLLKILDLRALRVAPGWRARVVCILILALLHVCLVPGVGEIAHEGWLLTIGGGSLVVWLVPRLIARVPTTAAAGQPAFRLSRHPFPAWWETFFHPRSYGPVPIYAGPRAPPL